MPIDIPGYRILNTLGKGGMATVYLAIQEVFEREVALKVMSKALAEDPNFSERFFREAKIVSNLVHPNIVTVHDVGMHEGCCYLSMEYIDGRDLRQISNQLSLRQKINAIRDIAKALDYAGSKGYVHRDIKPENIMFHSSDGRAVLLDFGIARAAEIDTAVTQTGIAIGTPHYMSPEQAKGRQVDNRSDIYSLGVVFFYILSGRVPFHADSAVAIGIKHITEPVPSLQGPYQVFEPLICKMMAKSVSERFQSAKDLIAEIDELDLDVIEHKIKFSRIATRHKLPGQVESNTPTVYRDVDADLESFELDDVSELPSFDTYELDQESYGKESVSILPWLLAGIFVVSVVTTFLYFRNPALFQPWLDQSIAQFVKIKEQVVSRYEASINQEPIEKINEKPEALSSLLPEKGLAEAESSPSMLQTESPVSAQTTPSASQEAEPLAVESEAELLAKARLKELDDLRELVSNLETAYQKDPFVLAQLVDAYRKLLKEKPSEKGINEKLSALAEQRLESLVETARSSGSSQKLSSGIEQAKALFPEIKDEKFRDIEQQADERRKVLTQLIDADAYLKQNNLTSPAGRNAVESYRNALKLDPGNEQAIAGIQSISRSLSELAEKQYQLNRTGRANKFARSALSVDPNNSAAKNLLEKIKAEKAKTERIFTLLSTAKQKMNNGDLFTPENNGAFHAYQAVLVLDPKNRVAKEGISNVVDALSAKAWQLVGDEQFDAARQLMKTSLKAYGYNDRVKTLGLAIDEVIESKITDESS